MIFYTSLQSAPCFIEDKPVLIPLGVDQDPHFRLTRDIAQKIGKQKPALIHNIMIPALTGPGGKMSASEEKGTIYTTDTPDVVKKKINKYAFSGGQPDIEQHRKLGGNPDIDVSYQYLRIFFEPDDSKLKKIYEDYKSGKIVSFDTNNGLPDSWLDVSLIEDKVVFLSSDGIYTFNNDTQGFNKLSSPKLKSNAKRAAMTFSMNLEIYDGLKTGLKFL